eukprot:s257_g13.t1
MATGTIQLTGDVPTEPSLRVASTTSSERRRRGSRGGTSNRSGRDGRVASEKRWRSGQVPARPSFHGDIDTDPFCLRHYRRKLWRWVRITKDFLPPNKQALRAREQLRGEAGVEFEEIDNSRFDCENGVQVLLDDCRVIREFESIGRLQGESVHAFVRRFRLTERKLQENRVHQYPEEAREYDPDVAWDDVENDEEDYDDASGDPVAQSFEPAFAETSLVSAGSTLDADGEVQSWTWTVSSEVKSDCVCLPALTANSDVALVETPQAAWTPPKDGGSLVFPIPSNPRVLLQYAGSDAALMIADTGCQRQVAGSSWHLNGQRDVHPLQVQSCPETCKSSFGPTKAPRATSGRI